MVEVFKTTVTDRLEADKILHQLIGQFPHYEINFDMEDCDNILRVQSPDDVPTDEISSVLQNLGHSCTALPN